MKHPMAALLCALVVATAASGCGGDGSSAAQSTSTAPSQAFTGTFVGTVALDAGRTATVRLATHSDHTAAGTLTISGGAPPNTVVQIAGFVDLIGGTFSLSGGTDTVSGTLPATASASGFLAVQLGIDTDPFHGTIEAA